MSRAPWHSDHRLWSACPRDRGIEARQRLDDGLRETIAFVREHRDLYRSDGYVR